MPKTLPTLPEEPLKTSSHEAFAHALARGATAKAAYLEHISRTGNETSAASEGPLIARKLLVRARVGFLKGRLEEIKGKPTGLLTPTERRDILAAVARDTEAQPATRVAAVKADAELAGDVDTKLVIEIRTI